MTGFTLQSRSWVHKHPNPRRVIEFYGGEAIGVTPNISYDALFDHLYDTQNTVIAMPVPIGPDHEEIAYFLLKERELILRGLGYDPERQPSCWMGHSIGGQFITLLASLTDSKSNKITLRGEQFTGAKNTPMLMIAPFIGDFNAPAWAKPLVNILGLEFKPTMAELEAQFENKKDLIFGKAGMLSFASDTDAGSVAACKANPGPACDLSVPWFNRFLEGRHCKEIPGDHLKPMGIQIWGRVYRPSLDNFSEPFPRMIDTEVVSLLNELDPPEDTMLARATAKLP
ncbi:MAG: DUF1350 family protein [Chloroflexales bacterium]